MAEPVADGIRAMLPREKMIPSARKLRDTYTITPGAPLFRREFGYYCLERWYEQGLARDANLAELFQYDPPGNHALWQLGWCEAAFCPAFEDKVIEDRGEHEVYQDRAGRGVLVFKGRRDGFMPEYVDHPVKDMKTWVENCKWRMDPATPERWKGFDERMAKAKVAAGQGLMISQRCVGPYMYLRSLIGPADLLYAFYDMPDVVHDCLRTWLALADAVIARHQQHVTLDEIFFAEDICYNHGPLISPEMMREFLGPYYRELLAGVRSRQIDRARPLYVQVDTDGFAPPTIPIYRELIGMNVMSPFEVAAGCDVVRVGRDWPDLVLFGGIDKRVLAQGPAAIDKMVERILPAMRERGGYIPTCDHGVPEEVTLSNYLHYRKRCIELGG
ncbi:MAG TPA: uroporphyrinogen decarboxylase family protein [Phycisphaerae bacterium]|nr:uroporphyrinogen decarboxylase family protein [Phycisphaerae bacterium]